MSGKPKNWARMCNKCGRKPVAHADAMRCYDCRVQYRRPAPPCKRCGSMDYWSAGLCVWCHKYGQPWATSCKYCLSWGVFRQPRLVCSACVDWRARNPGESLCRGCGAVDSVNQDRYCRLCYRRARAIARLQAGDPIDTRRAEAVTGGHQLFFDGMEHKLALTARGPHYRGRRHTPLHPTQHRARTAPRPGPIRPVMHRQGVLVELPRVLVRDGQPVPVPAPPLLDLAEALEAVAVQHGRQHGWGAGAIGTVRQALRILLALQDTPGAPIRPIEVRRLRQYPTRSMHVTSVLEVLESAGMLDDDRIPAIVAWFHRRVADLPAQMTAELEIWFEVMRHGSAVPPRQHPRADRTTRNNLTYALPVLRAWAGSHQSLREITRQDVLDALHHCRPRRRTDTLLGLRSIFRVLRGRKLTFINPTAGIPTRPPSPNIPLPLDIAELRDALNSPDPVRAALASLMIFHGLRPLQLRSLALTDVRDGRLHVDGRAILLAPQATRLLSAYLDHRARRWPATANPHVFVNMFTAQRTTQVNYQWVNNKLGILAQRMREDRILDEIHATGGDLRRVSDLFGLDISTTLRYAATINHPELNT